MRRSFAILLAALTLAIVGCTTRTDRDKNKDYDRPRNSAS